MADDYNFSGTGLSVVEQPAVAATDAPPVVEAPIVEAPAAVVEPVIVATTEAPVVATPPAIVDTPAFDEAKYIKESFGETFQSKDEIKSMLEKAKEFDAIKARRDELERHLAENDFADEYARAENKFVKEGGDRDIFRDVNKLDLDKMSDIDKVKKKLQLENKTLTNEDIDLLVRRKYKTDADESDLDDDVREARVNLKIDGKVANEFLSKYKVDSLVPPSVKQRTELQKQNEEAALQASQNIESWTKNYDTVVPKSKIIKFALDEKGSTLDYEVKFDSDQLKKETLSVIQMTGFKYGDDASKKEIERFLVNRKTQDELPNIIKAVANKVQTERDLHWIKETNNPGAVKKQDVPPASNSEKEKAVDNLVAAFK